MDFARMVIVIASHNRPAMLQDAIARWHGTAPNYRSLRVLLNHPDGARGVTLPDPARNVVTYTGRPPEHAGCMAETWNLAMLWAFRDPEVDWLLCAMDDAEPKDGWADLVAVRPADMYLAPAGDVAFLFNRRALREVGWFDQRFRAIGYQEWDWEARAYLALGPERVVVEDAHGWGLNEIGLSNYWHHVGGGAAQTTRNLTCQEWNRRWIEQKWGTTDVWHAARRGARPRIPEIEWYPWFDRSAVRPKEETR